MADRETQPRESPRVGTDTMAERMAFLTNAASEGNDPRERRRRLAAGLTAAARTGARGTGRRAQTGREWLAAQAVAMAPRLRSQQRIWSAFSKKRGSSRKAGPPVHDDLVARQFTAQGPDQTRLTDITKPPTGEGKLYLCAIKDVYSNRILGYSMDRRMTAGLKQCR
jgi:transposase InsO family protein